MDLVFKLPFNIGNGMSRQMKPKEMKIMARKKLTANGLTKLGKPVTWRFDHPGPDILETFSNRNPERDYIITFNHPEFTSLCPVTGQPDFAAIIIRYVADLCCLEAKSFKLYIAAFRNHGAFMESITNQIADDLIAVLAPRRLEVEGVFNVRGGTAITVKVEYIKPSLPEEKKEVLARLWQG
jgi:7-cyano-7-deazaguanine reductase